MLEQTRCPTSEELIHLSCGDLSGDQFELICQHVESCEHCLDRLSQLEDRSDDFTNTLSQIRRDELDDIRQVMEAESQGEMANFQQWVASYLPEKAANPTLSPPCQLGPYSIKRLIGRGGMGEVYEAHHIRLDRPVAVKVIRGYRQSDPVSHAHFLKEMTTAGKLDHPNLVRTHDAWEADGCLYMALELLHGDSLETLSSQNQLISVPEILEIMTGICRALEHLHENGLIHRDVKPANVMRLQDGSAKLIDFGLAITAASDQSAEKKRVGTKGYMAPEQASGTNQVDCRSDIYSTGCVLMFLLKFINATSLEASQAGQYRQLKKIAHRMVQPDPQLRYQKIDEVLQELVSLQKSATQDKKTTGKRTSWRTGLFLLLAATLGIVASQILFFTARKATITVVNYQQADVITLTGNDGKILSVKLKDKPQFQVTPGAYRLSLEPSANRHLTPSNINIADHDQLIVRIDQKPGTARDKYQLNKKKASEKPFIISMVKIPAGRFVMGASADETSAALNELPCRTIEFTKPFWMSTYEITVAQFRQFVDETGYVTEAEASGEGGWKATTSSSWGEQRPDIIWSSPDYQISESLPVTLVTYADAVAFCKWLSEKKSKQYRLPTEAEWEYACRAGSTGKYSFPIKSRDAYCWSRYNTHKTLRPRPVGTRQPNAWGLHNMAGNVREWCLDWYADNAYSTPFAQAPQGPASGTLRVIRGGCFIDLEPFLTSSHRGYLTPKHPLNDQGFRIISLSQ